MDFINKALDSTDDWLDKNRDDPSMNYVSAVGGQLFWDKIRPETDLGQWLNNDKQAGPDYRFFMKELFKHL